MTVKVRAAIPEQALDWVRDQFLAANTQVARTLSRVPTHREPELDLQFIAALGQAPAVTNISGWGIYLQTHLLGERRRLYNWEVADIGLLAIFRDRGKIRRIKVSLLQSKCLYPEEVQQVPEHQEDSQVGFGTLLQSPEALRALAAGRALSFRETCVYPGIGNRNDQQKALGAYEHLSGIPVYYLLYNPVVIPWVASIPEKSLEPLPTSRVGCRVVRSRTLDRALAFREASHHPSFSDVGNLPSPYQRAHRGGWSLEHFVADEFLGGGAGHVASSEADPVLDQFFYRRSAPIAAAIAVTVEAPEGVELVLPELPTGVTD